MGALAHFVETRALLSDETLLRPRTVGCEAASGSHLQMTLWPSG